jgi:hypothetical protein
MRKLTQKQKEVFIEALRHEPNVSAAAAAASASRDVFYRLRADDVAFAALWDDALTEGADRLESVVWGRAVDGWEEPVYGRVAKDRDGQIGTVRKYDSSLAALLLKAHKPEKYRERQDVNLSGNVTTKAYVSISPDDWDGEPSAPPA